MEGRKIDHTFYPVIYGAKEDEDWTSPEVWKKANPSRSEDDDLEYRGKLEQLLVRLLEGEHGN